MTEYRAGQKVRIEGQSWAIEGILFTGPRERLFVDMPGDDYEWPIDEWDAGRATVTVLSEPRPEEPTGLGAVVEAAASGVEGSPPDVRATWLRVHGDYWERDNGVGVAWRFLVDPVILSEGWTP